MLKKVQHSPTKMGYLRDIYRLIECDETSASNVLGKKTPSEADFESLSSPSKTK